MSFLKNIHHVAIICRNYEASKNFYVTKLGFQVLAEHFRADRQSYKLDLALDGLYCIELFSFPDPPARLSRPEGAGLRHLAFSVDDIEAAIGKLAGKGILCEPVRIDPFTGRRFTFFEDPDNLPIELYEV